MFKGIENSPFFIYSMFSTIHQNKDSLPVVLIKTPQGYYNHTNLSNREVEMLLNNAEYFSALNHAGSEDPMKTVIDRRFSGVFMSKWKTYAIRQLCNDLGSVKMYPDWWCNYFKSISTENVGRIEVVLSHVYIGNTITKSPVDSVLFTVNLTACLR